MLQRAVIILAAGGLLSACVSSNVTRLGNKTFEPIPQDEVAVYQSMDDIPEDMSVHKVAIIRTEANYMWDDREDLTNKMQEEAAKLGANGVVLSGFEDPGTGEKIANALIGVGGERKGRALAVRLTPNSRSESDGQQGDNEQLDGGDLPVISIPS